MAAIAGFAAVYVTLGRPDNAVPPARTTAAQPPRTAADGPGGPRQQSPEPGPDGRLRLPQGARGAAGGQVPGRGGQGAHAGGLARQGGARSTCGPPGACPAARKCRPSTGCRKRWAPTSSRWWPSASTAKAAAASKKFLDETQVERLALYVDATARLSSELRVVGLPATLLLDAQGREIGRLLGRRRVGQRGRQAADPLGDQVARDQG